MSNPTNHSANQGAGKNGFSGEQNKLNQRIGEGVQQDQQEEWTERSQGGTAGRQDGGSSAQQNANPGDAGDDDIDNPDAKAASRSDSGIPGRGEGEFNQGSLGSQQEDEEGGLGGQGIGGQQSVQRSGMGEQSDKGARESGHQVDDNQDDLGRDVNNRRRMSTNNEH